MTRSRLRCQRLVGCSLLTCAGNSGLDGVEVDGKEVTQESQESENARERNEVGYGGCFPRRPRKNFHRSSTFSSLSWGPSAPLRALSAVPVARSRCSALAQRDVAGDLALVGVRIPKKSAGSVTHRRLSAARSALDQRLERRDLRFESAAPRFLVAQTAEQMEPRTPRASPSRLGRRARRSWSQRSAARVSEATCWQLAATMSRLRRGRREIQRPGRSTDVLSVVSRGIPSRGDLIGSTRRP